MTEPTPRELVAQFYRDIWNQPLRAARMPVIERLIEDDFVFRGSLGTERRGREGFAHYVDHIHAALADYRCDILDLVCEGPRAFARMHFSGIHRGELLGFAPCGRRVEWHGAALFDCHAGRIAELWVLGDLDALRAQLAKGTH
jgi:predicted ester cyclase